MLRGISYRYIGLLAGLLMTQISQVSGQQAATGSDCSGRVWLRINIGERIDSIPAPAASVQTSTGAATTTDGGGVFQLQSQHPPKQLIFRSVGYQTLRLDLGDRGCQGVSVTLRPAVVELEEVQIESAIDISCGAPAEVKSIDARRIEQVNATHLGEALPYTPGVQVENNCQTCGYTQVRLNGLAGPYTQILIDGQSLVGGLNTAYGLDHLPTALIDRIEVLRGGGSAAYAANAVGGVVNVVTRRAQERGWGALQQSSILHRGSADDHLWRVHADWAQRPQPTTGRDKIHKRPTSATAFINHRLRSPYDHDGDGFSEVARLRGTSTGFLIEKRLSRTWNIRLNSLAIEEERRGGSDWYVAAPQARLTEEILQRSLSGHLEATYRNELTDREARFYLSRQAAQRKAFYGGSGDSLAPPHSGTGRETGPMGVWSGWNDSHISQYGQSNEQITQTGFRWNTRLFTGWRLLAGSELNRKHLTDALPVVERSIAQQMLTWSRFAQVEGQPHPSWRLHLGWRSDGVNLSGEFRQDTGRVIISYIRQPGIWRSSIRWQAPENRLALSLVRSGGYRAPQVFTEDLHVELVGGSIRSIRWSPQLREERSVGYSITAEYALAEGESNCMITAEGFHTRLMRPLLLNNLDTALGGAIIWQKSNGPDARVLGMVLGARGSVAGGGWQWDASISLQKSRYESTLRLSNGSNGELWSREMLRCPVWSGYFTIRRALSRGWWLQYNQQFTGSMWTTRTDATTQGELTLMRTPAMGQHDLWIEKLWKVGARLRMATELGCQNCMNNYQNDLSEGPVRDASYRYGPSMPRRLSLRIRLMG